jgi:hypothetical protein
MKSLIFSIFLSFAGISSSAQNYEVKGIVVCVGREAFT